LNMFSIIRHLNEPSSFFGDTYDPIGDFTFVPMLNRDQDQTQSNQRIGSTGQRSRVRNARYDLHEGDTHYEYVVDLPGIRKEDIQLSIEENGTVQIQAGLKEKSPSVTGTEGESEKTSEQVKKTQGHGTKEGEGMDVEEGSGGGSTEMTKAAEKKCRRCDRKYRCQFELPHDAKQDTLQAKVENGVLCICIEKMSDDEFHKRHTIAIN